MATKIVTKNSSTASAVPTASDLVQGELAVNVADKRLFTEDNAGAIVELGTNPSGNVTFQDNGKAIFGAGDDLQIYHDGSNSYINDAGTGNLYLRASNAIIMQSADGAETIASFHDDNLCRLYFDNAIKLATTSTGIDVTGTATMDGLVVDGAATIDGGATDNTVLTLDSGTANTYLKITDSNSTNGTFIGATTNDLNFYPNNSLAVTMTAAGNVGIGTSSPNAVTNYTGLTLNNATYGGFIDIENNGTHTFRLLSNTTASYIGTIESDPLVFNTADTERMRIDSSGNVGIGTSSPSSFNYLSTSPHLVVGGGSSDAGVTFYSSTNGYGRLAFADGTDSTEQYRGLIQYYHSDNSMQFYTGSDERMRIDASGNVGIGKTPNTNFGGYVLQLNGGAQTFMSFGNSTTGTTLSDGLVIGCDSGGADIYQREAQPLRFHTNNTERMHIDSSGNVGIGTSSPATTLNVKSSSYPYVRVTNDGYTGLDIGQADSGESGAGLIKLRDSAPLLFYTADLERMRIDSSGNLLVGTTSVGGTGGLSIRPNVTANATQLMFNRADSTSRSYITDFQNNGTTVGTISYTNTSTDYATSSDQRLKENIADADDAGSKIDAIQVRKFDWKADGSHQDYGMVAQELQSVAPEAVSVPEDSEEMMGVDYSKLVPMLIKEIQSLRNRVAQLEE